MAELAASVDALGYASLHMLGYHDSGMPDTETNARPDNFAERAARRSGRRFVRIIRAERPQVIITYRDERNFYPHPDHIRVHEISGPAFDAAGDPDAYPDAGEPWQPSKLYYVSWSIARVKALHAGVPRTRRGEPVHVVVRARLRRRIARTSSRRSSTSATTCTSAARRCSRTARRSIPNGHWMRLPDDVIREVFPWEEFTLVRSLVDNGVPEGEYEDDLFAGLRDRERRSCLTPVIVEFVVAAGKKEQAPVVGARSTTARSLERGDGAPADPADVTFTATPADAQALHDGTLDLSVGFMRGQVKMAGDFGALLHSCRSPAARAAAAVADLLPVRAARGARRRGARCAGDRGAPGSR